MRLAAYGVCGPIHNSNASDPNHWTLTTVTSASGRMPRTAALGWEGLETAHTSTVLLPFSMVPPQDRPLSEQHNLRTRPRCSNGRCSRASHRFDRSPDSILRSSSRTVESTVHLNCYEIPGSDDKSRGDVQAPDEHDSQN